MTAIEQVKKKETICDKCQEPMWLMGVGSYHEEGKCVKGTTYYQCKNAHYKEIVMKAE